jgi:hypothetical protein
MSVQIDKKIIDYVYDEWKEKGFPYYPTDYSWRANEFNKLIKFDRSTLFKPNTKAVGSSAHGLSLAWSYMPHHWGIVCGKMKTPMEIWDDEEHFKKGIKKLLSGTFWDQKEYHRITASDMRSLLRRYSGTQAVSNFRPTAAAMLYDKYVEKESPLFGTDSGVVWDMSCGYGGRLLGSITANINYIGTDPCTETFEGLKEIRNDWGNKKRTIELHKLGSEVFRPDKNSVDFCFTSPPYFDWEKYSDEDTQSYKKYETAEIWIEEFLRKTMENCYYGLKPGSILALNVADTKRIKNFESETVRLGKETGFKHTDTWYLQLSSQTGKPKHEPIFLFKK